MISTSKTIFDQGEAEATPKKIAPKWILGLCALTGFSTLLVILLAVQYFTIGSRLERLEKQPVVIQVGKNSDLVPIEAVTPEENVREFVRETVPMLFTLTKFVDRHIHPSGIDPGKQIGNQYIPTTVYIASQTWHPAARQGFYQGIAELIPEGFNQGTWLELKIDDIESITQVEGGWEVLLRSTLITRTREGVATKARSFDRKIFLTEVVPPKKTTETNSLQAMINLSLGRGLQIVDMPALIEG